MAVITLQQMLQGSQALSMVLPKFPLYAAYAGGDRIDLGPKRANAVFAVQGHAEKYLEPWGPHGYVEEIPDLESLLRVLCGVTPGGEMTPRHFRELVLESPVHVV